MRKKYTFLSFVSSIIFKDLHHDISIILNVHFAKQETSDKFNKILSWINKTVGVLLVNLQQ